MRTLIVALFLFASASTLAAPARISPLVDWLPKEAVSVWFSPIDASPLVRFLEASQQAKPDPCFAAQLKTLDVHVNVQFSGSEAPASLFHGRPNRDALEACLTRIFQRFGPSVSTERNGALSTYSQGANKLYAFWNKDWLFIDTQRAHIDALQRSLGGHTLVPALLERIKQVEPCVSLCVVGTNDMTTALLGLPSLGYALTLQVAGVKDAKSVRVPVRVFFATPETAQKATTMVHGLGSNAKLSAGLKKLIADLKPTLAGSEMRFDAGAVFTSDAALLKEAMAQLGASKR